MGWILKLGDVEVVVLGFCLEAFLWEIRGQFWRERKDSERENGEE